MPKKGNLFWNYDISIDRGSPKKEEPTETRKEGQAQRSSDGGLVGHSPAKQYLMLFKACNNNKLSLKNNTIFQVWLPQGQGKLSFDSFPT